MSAGHHPIRWQEADPIMKAVDALVAAKVPVVPIGDDWEHWQIGNLIFSDDDLWRLAASRGLVENGDSRRGAMLRAPSPKGARPRPDIRQRVLAELTTVPTTAGEMGSHTGLTDLKRKKVVP